MRNAESLEVLGTVTSVDEVSIAMRSGCPRCDRGEGCGQGAWLASRSRVWRLRVPTDSLPIATPVRIEFPAARLLQAATLAYGLPLLGLVCGAVVGQLLGGDPVAVAGSLIGLTGALLMVRRLAGRVAAHLQSGLGLFASK